MRSIVRVLNFVVTLIVLLALSAVGEANARNSLSAPIPPNIDVSQRAGNESEEAIAVNPTNPNNIVIFTNIAEGANGMFLATSFDGGLTWNRRIVGEGNDVFGDTCCDPSLAFDEYGNLFVSYLYNTENTVPVLLSTDGGLHFELIAKIAKPVDSLVSPSGSERHGLFRYVDQETITAAEGEVWITFNAGGPMVAAGGGFKQTLIDTKIADLIASFVTGGAATVLLVGWFVAVLIRLATGSATVATVTASGILAPLVTTLDPTHTSLLVLAIGAGSLFFSHVNDAGFWLVKEYFGLTVGQTIKTWSIMETIISVVGLIFVVLLGLVL